MWILKTEIWNIFVKCLEGIWKFENWNIWILKTKNWKLKCLKPKTENWNVWILKTKNWKFGIMRIEMFQYFKLKFEISYEFSSINFLFHSNDTFINPDLVVITNRKNTIISTPSRSCTKIQSTCRNPNIGFVTKCEVQGPMKLKVCVGVKHTFTNGEECKGWSPTTPKCTLTLGVALLRKLQMFRTFFGKANKHQIGPPWYH